LGQLFYNADKNTLVQNIIYYQKQR